MKVTYIHHSSFLVETESVSLLFDYAGGELPEIACDKPLIVLVSHRHEDHFSAKIFDLVGVHPETWYVISDDIWQKKIPEGLYSRVYFIDPGMVVQPEIKPEVIVRAFRSTDEGVAFLVTCDGKKIFHAGDLNNWMWHEESNEWNTKVSADYRAEIDKLSGTAVDAAFIPLDIRQGDWFHIGLDDFMTRVDANIVFPMHFWDDFSVIQRFKSLPCAKDYSDRIVEIHEDGELFEI